MGSTIAWADEERCKHTLHGIACKPGRFVGEGGRVGAATMKLGCSALSVCAWCDTTGVHATDSCIAYKQAALHGSLDAWWLATRPPPSGGVLGGCGTDIVKFTQKCTTLFDNYLTTFLGFCWLLTGLQSGAAACLAS